MDKGAEFWLESYKGPWGCKERPGHPSLKCSHATIDIICSVASIAGDPSATSKSKKTVIGSSPVNKAKVKSVSFY